MSSLITSCNDALAEIYKGRIDDLDEGSLEARECARSAPLILEEMADWSDSFVFARKRVQLASVTNDRPAEWLYAYASPPDMLAPLMIRQVETAATDLPIGGPWTFPHQDSIGLAFANEAGLIYSNVKTATLIYTRKNIEVGDLPPLGRRAFTLELATRLAWSLAKDKDLAARKKREAMQAKMEFIADEENKHPRASPRYISEVEYARQGIGV